VALFHDAHEPRERIGRLVGEDVRRLADHDDVPGPRRQPFEVRDALVERVEVVPEVHGN